MQLPALFQGAHTHTHTHKTHRQDIHTHTDTPASPHPGFVWGWFRIIVHVNTP